MSKIKTLLLAAAMVASPVMADAGNISPAYDNGWWGNNGFNGVVETASATREFVGDVGKGTVETATNIGKETANVTGEVAKTIMLDIPVGLVKAAGNAVAFNSWKEYWFF